VLRQSRSRKSRPVSSFRFNGWMIALLRVSLIHLLAQMVLTPLLDDAA
jgi:hypothetical protein